MKKILIYLIITITFSGCRSCYADYSQRKAGVKKVCPKCTFTCSENMYIAVDTTKNPNIIYKVRFRMGGFYHTASDVDELIKIQ